MPTITVDRKTINNLIKKQEATNREIRVLKDIIFEIAKDEIRPTVVKRFSKISKELDKNRGRRFGSFSAFKTYIRNL